MVISSISLVIFAILKYFIGKSISKYDRISFSFTSEAPDGKGDGKMSAKFVGITLHLSE